MPFCASCGAQVSGGFCPQCGTPVAGAGYGSTPPGGPSTPPPSGAGSSGLTENVAAALCYFFIPAIIFLVMEPYNRSKTIRFHAFQAIFLTAAWIVLNFALGIMGFLLSGLGFYYIGRLVSLGGLLLWLFLMYKAYNNERFVLPVIGQLAEKQA
jgi:uncharacterized membrane protein